MQMITSDGFKAICSCRHRVITNLDWRHHIRAGCVCSYLQSQPSIDVRYRNQRIGYNGAASVLYLAGNRSLIDLPKACARGRYHDRRWVI